MNEKNYDWFIEPLDSHTNEVLSREFPEGQSLQKEITCADGKRRTLWQCTIELARYLYRSKNDLRINFRIFGREGRGKRRSAGKLRDLTFLFKGNWPKRAVPNQKTKATA